MKGYVENVILKSEERLDEDRRFTDLSKNGTIIKRRTIMCVI